MKFEVMDGETDCGRITLEPEERSILKKAVMAAAFKAATEGPKIEKEDPLYRLTKIILDPDTALKGRILVRSPNLAAMAEVIATNNPNLAYSQAAQIGGFVTELKVAAKVLNQNALMTPLQPDEIDDIISNTNLPDSPGDIA